VYALFLSVISQVSIYHSADDTRVFDLVQARPDSKSLLCKWDAWPFDWLTPLTEKGKEKRRTNALKDKKRYNTERARRNGKKWLNGVSLDRVFLFRVCLFGTSSYGQTANNDLATIYTNEHVVSATGVTVT
jgi:hypothetical protein